MGVNGDQFYPLHPGIAEIPAPVKLDPVGPCTGGSNILISRFQNFSILPAALAAAKTDNIQYPDFKLTISPTFWQYPISSFEGCRALPVDGDVKNEGHPFSLQVQVGSLYFLC